MSAALQQAVESWREPKTRMVALWRNPGDKSSDNGLLFSSTYIALLDPFERYTEEAWFKWLVGVCRMIPGMFARYPGDTTGNAQDDLIGIVTADYLIHKGEPMGSPLAQEIYELGIKTDFSWNNEAPATWTWKTWLGRFLGFVPFLRAAAGLRIGVFGQLQIAAAFLWNVFEPREETSGKCLLYLQSKVFYGQHTLVSFAIDVWRLRMTRLYPGGPAELYAIYFRPEHPFALFGPTSWEKP